MVVLSNISNLFTRGVFYTSMPRDGAFNLHTVSYAFYLQLYYDLAFRANYHGYSHPG